MSMLDCSFAPKLYHLTVALEALAKDTYEKSKKFDGVKEYADEVFKSKAFSDTVCGEEVVIWGWTQAKAKAQEGTKGCSV